MITGAQPKLEAYVEDSVLKLIEPLKKWRLVREKDGLTKESMNIKWLEWNQDSTFKESFDEISIGRSLLMSPFNESFTWQTTIVSEILEVKDRYIKFKTGNSIYELFDLSLNK